MDWHHSINHDDAIKNVSKHLKWQKEENQIIETQRRIPERGVMERKFSL